MKFSAIKFRQFGGPVIFAAVFSIMFSCNHVPDETREYGWFPFSVPDLDTAENAVDMSFLNNRVAGEAGYVTVKAGHFVDGNGERIRFFGDNLTFGGCFPEKTMANRIAAALKKRGMNVVRFHHMDNRSAPNGIWNESMDDLDPGQLEKLDWLIYQLKLHGIYSNINTHVSFSYPGIDYDNINQFNYGKGIDNFYRPYFEMQKMYARKLLTHRNPFTGNTYADEPAVSFMEINNENSLMSNWKLLPELNSAHKAALLKQWKAWLSAHPDYRNTGGHHDLMRFIKEYDSGTSEVQKKMLWKFLMDTEMSYAKEMMDYFKKDLKVHALVAESQASYSGIAGILRESGYSDYIDMHAYWEHPSFPGQSWSSSNWLIRNSSMVSDQHGGTVRNFGQHRVKGMPLTISEYDHPAPTFFCAEMYPMLNSIASFQDLDGIYHFTFNGPYDGGYFRGFFSSAGHTLKQVFVPVGAALFRMEAVSTGKQPVTLTLSPGSVLDQLVAFGDQLRLHVSNMTAIWESAGATGSLIVQHPMQVSLEGKEPALSGPSDDPGGPWSSDTGEIRWDNRDSTSAVFTVNTPLAKVAAGYIGGKVIDLGNITVAMDTTPYNWATITITALDGKPLNESAGMLLVAAGRVENTDMGWNENKTTVGEDWGRSPVQAEGIPARLVFKDMDPFTVHVLDSAGNLAGEIGTYTEKENRVLNIGAQYRTIWYKLTR